MKFYTRRGNSARIPRGYYTAVETFIDRELFGKPEEFCLPYEDIPRHPHCIRIAQYFGKTPEQVAKDINRRHIQRYRPMRKRNGVYRLNLVEDFE